LGVRGTVEFAKQWPTEDAGGVEHRTIATAINNMVSQTESDPAWLVGHSRICIDATTTLSESCIGSQADEESFEKMHCYVTSAIFTPRRIVCSKYQGTCAAGIYEMWIVRLWCSLEDALTTQ